MICQGQVVYKGVEKREGGSFKNDKGQEVEYTSSYLLKFDELVDGDPIERKVKFPSQNKELYNKFKELDVYTKVTVEFEVKMGQNTCKLIPVAIVD